VFSHSLQFLDYPLQAYCNLGRNIFVLKYVTWLIALEYLSHVLQYYLMSSAWKPIWHLAVARWAGLEKCFGLTDRGKGLHNTVNYFCVVSSAMTSNNFYFAHSSWSALLFHLT
jgi:hypothetical protein